MVNHSYEWIQFAVIFVSGIVAGSLNIVAGGGSLITVPILIFLGVPPATANGTNRIAILFQNTVATYHFIKKGHYHAKTYWLLGSTAVLGAIIGTRIALDISGSLFNKLLAIMMICAAVAIVFDTITRKSKAITEISLQHPLLLAGCFFFVGIYGGFIQAGVGIIMMALITLIGRVSLVTTNSIKVFVTLVYTVPSLVLFIISGKIDWHLAFALAGGNAIGGWIGSTVAMKSSDVWIRVILLITVCAMAIKLFFVK